MRSKTTRRFRELLSRLPQPVQAAAAKPFALWLADPEHSALRFKPLKHPMWSVRVPRDYRAIALIEDDEAVWV